MEGVKDEGAGGGDLAGEGRRSRSRSSLPISDDAVVAGAGRAELRAESTSTTLSVPSMAHGSGGALPWSRRATT